MMPDAAPVSTGTLENARELLNAELPDPRFVDERYLRWLYHENPYGEGIYGFRYDDAGRCVGHYGLIPQRYATPGGPIRFMFSLNAVSRTGGQRRGVFVSLTKELFARAAEADYVGAVGVTNDNSTRAVKRTAFRYLGPMPVVVQPRRPGRKTADRWHHHSAADVCGNTALADELCGSLVRPARRGVRNEWTSQYLRWRLGSPNSRPYTVHSNDRFVVVSTVHHVGPVPVGVVLKVLAREAPTTAISGGEVMQAVAEFHGAPAALYAGFNCEVAIGGWHPPRRLLPAPLNLNYVPFNGTIPATSFDLETYEFFDCDAY